MATGALLSSTRVKLVLRPRIATLRPSPVISRRDVDAGNAVEGLGQVRVRELADVFGEDRVEEPTESRFFAGRVRRGCGESR